MLPILRAQLCWGRDGVLPFHWHQGIAGDGIVFCPFTGTEGFSSLDANAIPSLIPGITHAQPKINCFSL